MSQEAGPWELGDTERERQGGQSQETAKARGTCLENQGSCYREGEARGCRDSRWEWRRWIDQRRQTGVVTGGERERGRVGGKRGLESSEEGERKG